MGLGPRGQAKASRHLLYHEPASRLLQAECQLADRGLGGRRIVVLQDLLELHQGKRFLRHKEQGLYHASPIQFPIHALALHCCHVRP